jgi:N-acetyl-anhydromuramyl-L-alanine amidase AmpD
MYKIIFGVFVYLIFYYFVINRRNYKNKTKRVCEWKSRKISDIESITIHHTATENENIQSFTQNHIDRVGGCGIGYHYIIGKDGVVKKLNDIRKITYHNKNNNSSTVGVCLVGNFDKEMPTEKQLKSLKKIVTILKAVTRTKKVRSHSDYIVGHTSCCGKNLIPFVRTL